MSKDEKEKLLIEYKDRNIRWTDKAVNQLSYFNNLLLTLSIGFISFSYKSLITNNYKLNLSDDVDWYQTIMSLSLLLMLFAVYKGLIISLSRLMDFRISRQIVQVRQRMLEHAGKKMDESSSLSMPWFDRSKLIWSIFRNDYPKITIEDCKNYDTMSKSEKEEINCNFKGMRRISHNLGINTWKGTYSMIIFFGISIILYVLAIFLKPIVN